MQVSLAKSTKNTFTGYGVGSANMDADFVQYDIPKNSYKRANSDINYEVIVHISIYVGTHTHTNTSVRCI